MKMKFAHSLKPLGALALTIGVGAVSASAEQFTIAVIPDTQNYCDTANPSASPQPASVRIYQREMQYLADQKTAQNIVFVTHVGDVVQHGDLYPAEWQNAQSAMNILAASGIPFGMSPGNHDYDNYSHTPPGNRPLVGNVMWNQYFGPNSPYFAGKSWYGGTYTDPTGSGGTSSFQKFSAGGKTFLHINLAMEASDATIAWADAVMEAYPGVPTIVTTHEYIGYDFDALGKARRLNDGYMTGLPANSAQEVWDKFISQNDQIFLVVCGHNWSSTVNGVSDGENLRVDDNAFGHPVFQVLSDYQGNTFDAYGTPGALTGGAGWLRLMAFDTDARTIHFQTYSSELHEYAGVGSGPTFNLPARMSDFTLPIPDRVFPPAPLTPAPWKFGVLSDTQWTVADDGTGPESLPAGMIQQIDEAFIANGVKLVISVGDTVDTSTPASLATRALFAQDLYNAGIAFYPVRGNHESEWTGSAADFAGLYPQIISGGVNNLTPYWDTTSWVEASLTATDLALQTLLQLTADFNTTVPPASPSPWTFALGGNFSYPANNCPLFGVTPYPGTTSGGGLSYSFDFNNVRFVLIDQFVDSDPGGNTSSTASQQPWITQRLADSQRPLQAFVFSHKQLLGGNHKDNLFGGNVNSSDPGDGAAGTPAGDTKRASEDAFITSLADNNVHYLITGHDHHHSDSVVRSPLNSAKAIHQIISQSDSSKFYTPHAPFSANQTSISEELYDVGCYIYTVDGPRVTVDYYGVPAGTTSTFAHAPVLTGNWEKRLTFGYSLNGREFRVAEGAPYTVVADDTTKASANTAIFGESGYHGTAMAILAGANMSKLTTHDGRALTKAVDTGWAPGEPGQASDVLTLWGMDDVGTEQSDVYVLSMSFDKTAPRQGLGNGGFGIASRDANGNWVNAAAAPGVATKFVNGPWKPGYVLGTYGVDPSAKTAWVVINYDGNFAVMSGIEPPPGKRP